MTDEIAQQLGFADTAEFVRLIAAPDLSKSGALERFKSWQNNNGTKQGLLTAFPEIEEGQQS